MGILRHILLTFIAILALFSLSIATEIENQRLIGPSLSGPFAVSANILDNLPYSVVTNNYQYSDVTINNNLAITGNLKVGEDVADSEKIHVYSGAVDGEILMETNNSKDASITLMESTGTGSDSDFGIKGSGFRIRHDGGDNKIYFETGATATVATSMGIDRVTSYVGIGTVTPQRTLSVNGDAQVTGNAWVTSYVVHPTDGTSGQYFGLDPASPVTNDIRIIVSGNVEIVTEKYNGSAWINGATVAW